MTTASLPSASIRRWLLAGLAAALLAATVPTASAALPEPPQALPDTTEQLVEGLETVADASNLTQARQAHAGVEPLEPRVLPHTKTLAGRHGELAATLMDELEAAIARGNLSDARSLAQAAASTLREDVMPPVERWDRNRTAVTTGPPRWVDDAIHVPVILVNPPPGGIGAFDVEVSPGGTPTAATLAHGQGEERIDEVNGTARLASFDARALTHLDTTGRASIVLGEITLAHDELRPGDTLNTSTELHALADAEGSGVLAVTLASTSHLPAAGEEGLLGPRAWAIGGVVAGALGLVFVVRRLEV